MWAPLAGVDIPQRGVDRLPEDAQRQVAESQQPKADTDGEDQDSQDQGLLGSLRVCPLPADALPAWCKCSLACCSNEDLPGSLRVCLHAGDATMLWFALDTLLHCDVTKAAGSRHSSFST